MDTRSQTSFDLNVWVHGRPYTFVTTMQSRLGRTRNQEKNAPSNTECKCKEREERCGPLRCDNALDYRSCTPESCSWGCSKHCKNTHAQSEVPGLKVIDTVNGTGKGLACNKDLGMGDFVVSYIGELYHKRGRNWVKKQEEYSSCDGLYYSMDLRDGFIVNAYAVGNHASFMNHSC